MDVSERPDTWHIPPVSFREPDFKQLLKTLSQKKIRGGPAWLWELVGWGGFIGILSLFLLLQIFLNGVLKGLVSQFAIGISIVLEIGLLWLWELYWY